MDRDEWQARGRSFGAIADVYDRVRPTYPDRALDWLLPPAARRVLDLGAGTGKLTGQLVARGLDVVAVEPSEQMRSVLVEAVPGAEVRSGTAERVPLPDADVDAVLVGQAWHWFDRERATQEVVRVLRPGGTLGLLWNARDTSIGWVADLWRVWDGEDTDSQRRDRPPLLPDQDWFVSVEQRTYGHGQELDLPTLLDLVRSRSYVIVLPEDERAAKLDRITALVRTHPDLRDRDTFTLPYRTEVTKAIRM